MPKGISRTWRGDSGFGCVNDLKIEYRSDLIGYPKSLKLCPIELNLEGRRGVDKDGV